MRAQWQTVGSQFHWPPLVSELLQPILAHGPRFWPRPATIATGKPRAHGPRQRASSDGEGVLPDVDVRR